MYRTTALAFFVVLFAAITWGNEEAFSWKGEVIDKNGKPVVDATVCIAAFGKLIAETKTDSEGGFQLSSPQNAKLKYLYAFKSGEGFDFIRIEGEKSPKDSYKLTFKGVNPVRIRFVDQNDKPIAGRGLDSWIIVNDRNEDFNTAEANERRFVAKSDEQGYVHFACLPAGCFVNFMPDWSDEQGRMSEKLFFTDPYWHPARDTVYNPSEPVDEIVVKLAPTVRISGKVQFEDGRPVSQVRMALFGRGFMSCDIPCNPGPTRADFERLGCATDKDGKYEMTLYGDMLYVFGPGSKNIDGQWYGAAPKRDVVSKVGMSYDHTDFVYKPFTKVTGQIIEDGKSLAEKMIYFYRYSVHSNDLPPEKQLENRSILKAGIQHPILDFFNQKYSAKTDSQGRFEISLPPGIHAIVEESDGRLAEREDLRSGSASLKHLFEFELDGEQEKDLKTISIRKQD